MALREFTDRRGRHWKVWDVNPTLAERRLRNAGPPAGRPERRRYVEPRARLDPTMAKGWLVFEASDGERRRLAPIPAASSLNTASDEQLRTWCELATPAPPARRLIE